MNISGVTQTAQVLPQTQAPEPPPPPEASSSQSSSASTGADTITLSVQVSTQVMDMAQQQFEDAANQLISQMASVPVAGSNVDMSV